MLPVYFQSCKEKLMSIGSRYLSFFAIQKSDLHGYQTYVLAAIAQCAHRRDKHIFPDLLLICNGMGNNYSNYSKNAM